MTVSNKIYMTLDHALDSSKEYFIVNWTLNNICNFSCSYCLPKLYDGSVKGVDLEVTKAFIARILILKKDKKVVFKFTGGEITYYPQIKELFSYIKENGGYTAIITNGSRSLEWWQEHYSLIDHACLSFHSEKGQTEHFYNVVSYLYNKIPVHINIMMIPEKFNDLLSFAKKLSSEIEGIGVAIQALFENFNGKIYPYNEEQIEILKKPDLKFATNLHFHQPEGLKHNSFRGMMKKILKDGQEVTVSPEQLITNQENSWFGWYCMAGVENLVVGMDGSVRRGVCKMGGLVGFIQDPNLLLPTEAITCLVKRCTCAFDIMSTKSLMLIEK
jgi:organic radical activating enzyme